MTLLLIAVAAVLYLLMESRVNTLQTALAEAQADLTALAAAVAAAQAMHYTPADVVAVQALSTQAKALTASLAPPAPAAS